MFVNEDSVVTKGGKVKMSFSVSVLFVSLGNVLGDRQMASQLENVTGGVYPV